MDTIANIIGESRELVLRKRCGRKTGRSQGTREGETLKKGNKRYRGGKKTGCPWGGLASTCAAPEKKPLKWTGAWPLDLLEKRSEAQADLQGKAENGLEEKDGSQSPSGKGAAD